MINFLAEGAVGGEFAIKIIQVDLTFSMEVTDLKTLGGRAR